MEGLNDVVRHIILRIIVDQAGFAEGLAAAREKLKALKDSEREINKDRIKGTDEVTKAVGRQSQALDENARSHEAAHRASRGTSQATVEQTKAVTESIKEQTKQVEAKTIAEARAAQIASKTRQAELDSQRARSAANKKAAAEVERMLADAAKLNEQANAVKANAVNARRLSRDESESKITRLDANAEATRSVPEERRKGLQDRNAQSLATQVLRDVEAVSVAQAQARVAASRALNEEDKTGVAIEERRNSALRGEQKHRQDLARLAAQTMLVDERALEVQQRRERASAREAERQAVHAQRADPTFKPVRNQDEALTRVHDQAIREDDRRTAAAERNAQQRAKIAEREARQAERVAKREADQAIREAERAAKEIERVRAIRRRGSVSVGAEGLFGNLFSVVGAVASSGLDNTRVKNASRDFREVRDETSQATSAAKAFFAALAPGLSNGIRELRRVRSATSEAGSASAGFFRGLKAGGTDAASVFEHITARVRNLVQLVKPAAAGGGGLIGDIFGNLATVGNGFTRMFEGMGKHLFSFQSLIIAVIAALGPLAAIIGAVGAAALGLASNLGALSGVLFAMPGAITAMVGAFGALALVIQPLTSVVSAYNTAQKQLTGTTLDAKNAVDAYRLAVLTEKQAERDYHRAQQDGPRLQRQLNDARKQATRQIEDYRSALKRLKYDEEGASLGIDASMEQYRRALADPTASNLDRAEALHNLQGSYLNKDDQQTQDRRTREDAAAAFKLGVNGSDAVVTAQRAVEDQTYKVATAYYAWQKAIIATHKSALEKVAGGIGLAEYQRELNKMPASTRKVATAIIDLIKSGGPFQQLRNRLSENFFGPISGETGKFKDVLDELGKFLAPIATVLGQIAKAALDLFTSPSWKAFFERQGASSADLLSKMASAGFSLADAFTHIIDAAAPFTSWLAGAIAGVAQEFDNWTKSTNKSGKSPIESFLELTKKRLQEIWPIIKNLAIGFAGFFTALNTPSAGSKKDFTTSLNEGLLGAAKNFAALGKAAADPKSGFHKWLDNVLPLLKDVWHFLGQAGAAIGKLFSDKRNLDEAHNLLKNLADKWLPRLAEIFSDLSKSGVISKLSSAIGAAFGAIKLFLDHGGLTAIQVFADVLGGIGSAIEWITKNIPALSYVLGALAVVMAGAFGVGMVLKIGKLISSVTGLTGAARALRGVLSKKFSFVTPPAPKPGSGSGSGGGFGSAVGSTEEIALMRRMVAYLRQIAFNTGGVGNSSDLDLDENGKEKGKGGKHRRGGKRSVGSEVADDVEEGLEKGGKKGLWRRILGRGGAALASDAGSIALSRGASTAAEAAAERTAARGAASTAERTAARSSAASAAESSTEKVAERAATKAAARGAERSLGSTLLRAAGHNLKGGLVSLVAGTAAEVGGGYLIDKYVKNDKDRGSLNRGLGAVATGAGVGAAIGSIIPGVGTVIGGAVGGLVGGAYSLVRDKNLRHFVGSKLQSAGRAVGGAITSVGRGVGNFVSSAFGIGGDDDERRQQAQADIPLTYGGPGSAPALGGAIRRPASSRPASGLGTAAAGAFGGAVGLLASRTDVGRSVTKSIDKAGGHVRDFFTKSIPNAFQKGVSGIGTFFTKTLPALPGKFFDAFFHGVGRIIHFFTDTLPHAAGDLFTRKIPHAAGEAWNFVKARLWQPFLNFIKGIPKFFTETIPKWFHEAPKWFHTHVIAPVGDFFTKTVPSFFTKTLPDAIKGIPGWIYGHLVQPILDFFKGLAGHVGDFLKGSWNWAKGLFTRAGKDVQEGEQAKMSGGLIAGVYQGVEDTVRLRATPDEFVVRRSKVMEPGAKAFLSSFNERGMEAVYSGLSASMQPPVMSMVPPSAAALTGAVPTVVNNTVNHAPLLGDVTINNPVREPAGRSLRHQIQVAAIRHRL